MSRNPADRPATEPPASADYVSGFRAGRDAERERAEAAQGAAPRAEGLPDMSVLAAILDDVPAQVANTLSMDGEGLAAWIVGHWPEYARLSRPSDERVPESET